jgi:hypothetical protein
VWKGAGHDIVAFLGCTGRGGGGGAQLVTVILTLDAATPLGLEARSIWST